MPSVGPPRPNENTYDSAVAFLEASLNSATAAQPNPGRTDTLRRLTRTEYQNAIRDLLAIEVDFSSLLPRDESSQGFDNITVTDLSPALLENYVSAADKLSMQGEQTEPFPSASRVLRDERVGRFAGGDKEHALLLPSTLEISFGVDSLRWDTQLAVCPESVSSRVQAKKTRILQLRELCRRLLIELVAEVIMDRRRDPGDNRKEQCYEGNASEPAPDSARLTWAGPTAAISEHVDRRQHATVSDRSMQCT